MIHWYISAKMLAIYVVTLLVLLSSDMVPSKVHAGSSDSGDSDQHYCKNAPKRAEKVQKTIKKFCGNNLPTCTCGLNGTISKFDFGNTETVSTCKGCTGPEVPIASSSDCKNVPDCTHPHLEKFCEKMDKKCKDVVTVYRCSCPVPTTTTTTTTTTAAPPPEAETPGVFTRGMG